MFRTSLGRTPHSSFTVFAGDELSDRIAHILASGQLRCFETMHSFVSSVVVVVGGASLQSVKSMVALWHMLHKAILPVFLRLLSDLISVNINFLSESKDFSVFQFFSFIFFNLPLCSLSLHMRKFAIHCSVTTY